MQDLCPCLLWFNHHSAVDDRDTRPPFVLLAFASETRPKARVVPPSTTSAFRAVVARVIKIVVVRCEFHSVVIVSAEVSVAKVVTFILRHQSPATSSSSSSSSSPPPSSSPCCSCYSFLVLILLLLVLPLLILVRLLVFFVFLLVVPVLDFVILFSLFFSFFFFFFFFFFFL